MFAVPFVVRGAKRQPKGKISLTGSNSESFLNAYAYGEESDIGLDKIIVHGPGVPDLTLINLYSNPKPDNRDNFDADTFLGLTMTQGEYGQISAELGNFDPVLHPVMAQIESDDGQESIGDSQPFRKVVLRLTGYSSTGSLSTVILNGTGHPVFYGLELNLSQYFNTDMAGSLENAPIVDNPTEITIDHDPHASSEEREKYDEIREALVLVKMYLGEAFDEIQNYVSSGRLDTVPILRYNGNQNPGFDDSEQKWRKYAVEIRYETPQNTEAANDVVIFGEIDSNLEEILIKDGNGSESKQSNYRMRTPPYDYEGENPNHYINITDYEEKALDNSKSPEDIAREYIPEVFIYSNEDNDFIPTSIESTVLKASGRAINKPEYTIRVNPIIRQQGNAHFLTDDPIAVEITGSGTDIPLEGDFKNISKRTLKIASVIAHEFGHVLSAIKSPLLVYAWNYLLETQYDVEDNHTDPTSITFPSFMGDGHLEGNPSGNLSARLEFMFGKNAVENELWVEAKRIIEKYDNFNYTEDWFLFQAQYLPGHLKKIVVQTDVNDVPVEIKFELRDYLRGNLRLKISDLPPNLHRDD